MAGNARPWCCPEPRCTPLLNLRDGDYRDITVPEPGQSWFCWGLTAEPVTFVYDGVEHTNDRNSCSYTPLKGVLRWQENEGDWSVLASYYRMAGEKAAALRADTGTGEDRAALGRLTLNDLRARAEAAGITYWDDGWRKVDFIDALVRADTGTGEAEGVATYFDTVRDIRGDAR